MLCYGNNRSRIWGVSINLSTARICTLGYKAGCTGLHGPSAAPREMLTLPRIRDFLSCRDPCSNGVQDLSSIISAASNHNSGVWSGWWPVLLCLKQMPQLCTGGGVSKVEVLHQHIQGKSLFWVQPLDFHHLKTSCVSVLGLAEPICLLKSHSGLFSFLPSFPFTFPLPFSGEVKTAWISRGDDPEVIAPASVERGLVTH